MPSNNNTDEKSKEVGKSPGNRNCMTSYQNKRKTKIIKKNEGQFIIRSNAKPDTPKKIKNIDIKNNLNNNFNN